MKLVMENPSDFAKWLTQQPKMKGCCECCGRSAQIYKRKLHSTVVRQLIKLYRLGGAHDYVFVYDIAIDGDKLLGDFTKGLNWYLIEKKEGKPDNGAKSNGMYRLTEYGVSFVEGKSKVPEYVYLLFNQLFAYSDNMLTIDECLAQGGFNYDQLMRGE